MTSLGIFLTKTLVFSVNFRACFLEISTLSNFCPLIDDLSMMAALSHTGYSQQSIESLTTLEICKENFGEDLFLRSLKYHLRGDYLYLGKRVLQHLFSGAQRQIFK